jgi:hypothetical protein
MINCKLRCHGCKRLTGKSTLLESDGRAPEGFYPANGSPLFFTKKKGGRE